MTLGFDYSHRLAIGITPNLYLTPMLCATLQATHWRTCHDYHDLHHLFGNRSWSHTPPIGYINQRKRRFRKLQFLMILMAMSHYLHKLVEVATIFIYSLRFQIKLGKAPLLWELGNNAARPLCYFLTNPGVWDGIKTMCGCTCKKKHQLVSNDDMEEAELPLAPVTTV